MGLFSWIVDKVEEASNWVQEKVENAVDWVKDKLSKKTYNEDCVEDHVDVDAVLAEFRKTIEDDLNLLEKDYMDSVSSWFDDLMEKVKEKFPDLLEIIKNEQEKAENELQGTITRYVKEHLSKNDSKFLEVLKMRPGRAKEAALSQATDRVFEEAGDEFRNKLKRYAKYLLEEISFRLNTRISNQEKQMNRRISELEKMQKESETGQIDIDALKESCVPTMEAAECIIQILEMEM